MKTLTNEEWKMLQEMTELVKPRDGLKQFELIKIREARRLLGQSEDKQNTIS